MSFRILGLEEEELRRDHVRDLVLDLAAEEDDALLQEARVDVERALRAPVGVDDHRDELAHVASFGKVQPLGCAHVTQLSGCG
jgi:hypothetical protein